MSQGLPTEQTNAIMKSPELLSGTGLFTEMHWQWELWKLTQHFENFPPFFFWAWFIYYQLYRWICPTSHYPRWHIYFGTAQFVNMIICYTYFSNIFIVHEVFSRRDFGIDQYSKLVHLPIKTSLLFNYLVVVDIVFSSEIIKWQKSPDSTKWSPIPLQIRSTCFTQYFVMTLYKDIKRKVTNKK